METSHRTETQHLNTNVYPEVVSETKHLVNPQAILWAIIAVVLYIIYSQQPEKDTTLGIIQITLVIGFAVLAIVKFFASDHKLTYNPTGSAIAHEERYYNIALERDILQCIREGNTSRLNALKTDDAGGIQVETLKSKDNVFTAVRMQKYHLEGYRPLTEWVVMP